MMPIVFVRPIGPCTAPFGIAGFGRCRQNPQPAIRPNFRAARLSAQGVP
ncbi:MAG: hypothetical protein IOC63_08990 [Methylobacterium sp.]|nr:hypothetical protein [Methylobacterium sp.]